MNVKSAARGIISNLNVCEVGINEEEFSANVIESPTINGLYLGWIRKDTHTAVRRHMGDTLNSLPLSEWGF